MGVYEGTGKMGRKHGKGVFRKIDQNLKKPPKMPTNPHQKIFQSINDYAKPAAVLASPF